MRNKTYSKKIKYHLFQDADFKLAMKGVVPLDLPATGNVFIELVKAVVYQQISYKAADTIYQRFEALVGKTDYTPKDLLGIQHSDFRKVGFSNRKAEYAHNIASFFKSRSLYNFDWSTLKDEEIIGLLTQIKGVGEWTVQMILMFQLKREDVFPVKDLGIQQAIQAIYHIEGTQKQIRSEMLQLAEVWKPYRTMASFYLWAWKRLNP